MSIVRPAVSNRQANRQPVAGHDGVGPRRGADGDISPCGQQIGVHPAKAPRATVDRTVPHALPAAAARHDGCRVHGQTVGASQVEQHAAAGTAAATAGLISAIVADRLAARLPCRAQHAVECQQRRGEVDDAAAAAAGPPDRRGRIGVLVGARAAPARAQVHPVGERASVDVASAAPAINDPHGEALLTVGSGGPVAAATTTAADIPGCAAFLVVLTRAASAVIGVREVLGSLAAERLALVTGVGRPRAGNSRRRDSRAAPEPQRVGPDGAARLHGDPLAGPEGDDAAPRSVPGRGRQHAAVLHGYGGVVGHALDNDRVRVAQERRRQSTLQREGRAAHGRDARKRVGPQHFTRPLDGSDEDFVINTETVRRRHAQLGHAGRGLPRQRRAGRIHRHRGRHDQSPVRPVPDIRFRHLHLVFERLRSDRDRALIVGGNGIVPQTHDRSRVCDRAAQTGVRHGLQHETRAAAGRQRPERQFQRPVIGRRQPRSQCTGSELMEIRYLAGRKGPVVDAHVVDRAEELLGRTGDRTDPQCLRCRVRDLVPVAITGTRLPRAA